MNFELLRQYSFFNNTVEDIAIAFAIFIGIYTLIYIFKRYLAGRLSILVQKTKTNFDDILLEAFLKVVNVGGMLFALYIAHKRLLFPEAVTHGVSVAFTILFTLFFTWIVQSAIVKLIDEYFKNVSKSAAKSLFPFIKNVINLFIWFMAGIFILSNLGYSIASLAAGLGIGGLAVALAIKPSLESFFASVAIFTDKPFQIGDYISYDGKKGTIKHIGLRTTILKTTAGTDLIVPNTELVNSTVENIQNRTGQRIDASVGVVYDTTTKKLEKGVKIIQDILEKQENVQEDIRVHFSSFGDSALIIEFVYFVEASLPYTDRIAIISNVNFAIKRAFEKEKLEMAFPTQTLYLKK